MRKLLLLCAFLGILLSGYSTIAQDHVVTGKVTSSEDGTALVGVSVQVKGSSQGVNSNADGEYRISVSPNATLVFSFVGMSRKEVVVGNQTVINVELGTDNQQLSEVVVTGFGSQIKRDVTGNIAKVDSKKLENIPSPSFETALQGNAAGVQITQGNGKLGQGISVRVRGTSSVSASSQPLYVVDGVPITTQDLSTTTAATNPIADLNPQDIESLEILKDASAGAIYGARAANGVVLITTKRGKSGKTNVSVGFQYGSSKPTRLKKYMNAEQWMGYMRTAAANTDAIENDNYYSTVFIPTLFNRYAAGTELGTVNTDWQSQAFQKAPFSQTDLNISGGNEKTRFYISGQYLNQKGILISNSLERYTGRINLDHKANKWLSLGMNMSLARTLQNRVSNDNAFSTPMQIVALSPITPVTDPRSGLISGTPPGAYTNYPIYYNPLISAKYADYQTLVFRNISNVYAQIDITNGLSFRSELGVDILTQNENMYYGSETVRNVGTATGDGTNAYAQVMNYNTNNYFNYNKSFGGVHSLTATLGMSYQDSRTDANSVTGQQFPSNAYRYITSAADITNGSSTRTQFAFLSYFLRANYKFADKYLLGLSGRVDGSSRFGNDSKYGFFPAASAGWILSEESFLKESNTFSFLKFRASYGLTGNAEIGNFPALGLWAASYGYAGVAGQGPYQLANPNLKWETTRQADFGIDYGFFNNRINGEIDYYVKNTNDLLLSVNVPGTSGFITQVRNVGKMKNQGFEFTLNSQNLVGAFKWTTSLNFSTNKNRVTALATSPSGDPIAITGGADLVNRAYPGQPLGAFYMYEYAGVDRTNGDALYYVNASEGDRTTTNNPNQANPTFVGSPLPKWFGGITNTFSFAGVDFSFLFNGQFGNKIYMGGAKYEMASGDYLDNHVASELDYWSPENPNASTPQPRLLQGNGTVASSRYLSEASYVRLRNVSLGYTLPRPLLQRLKVEKIRIYALAQNLLTFTKYKGWDPEVNSDMSNNALSLGQDFYSAPQAKTITFGIQLGF